MTISTTGSATLTADTTNDDADEPASMVTATVTSGTGYSVGHPDSAGVTVADDDPDTPAGPRVTISAVTGQVTEGDSVEFTVRANPLSAASLAMTVELTEADGRLAAPGPRTLTVTINAGASTATLTANTGDDNADEPNGTVTATITGVTGDGGYAIGSPSSATVTVRDDEGIEDPEVTIQAGTSPVTEGDPIEFTVTATPAPATSLVVNVQWSDPDSRLAGSPPATVTISTSGSATLTASTEDDDAPESNSTVTATVAASGTGYTVGSAASASVTVEDNDGAPSAGLPTVRFVSAEPSSVAEGGSVRVFLSITPAPTSTITVYLDAFDSKRQRNHDGIAIATFSTGGALTASSTFIVPPTVAVETDRTVKFTMYSVLGYVNGSPDGLTVNVTDVP